MVQAMSLFNQLLQHFPSLEFAALVRKHRAERAAKGFSLPDAVCCAPPRFPRAGSDAAPSRRDYAVWRRRARVARPLSKTRAA